MELILQAKDLSVGYALKPVLLQKINLEFKKGRLIALLGPNGAGKSSLLRTLCGLNRPVQGQILLENRPLSDWPRQDLAKRISLGFNQKIDLPQIRVQDLLLWSRHLYTDWMGQAGPEDLQMIEEAVHACHLQDLQSRSLAECSDGERQRAMIASCLVQNSVLIFLDEPTAHLDIKTRHAMFRLFQSLKQNRTFVVCTHELDLAMHYADEILLIEQKSLIQGKAEELEAKIRSAFDLDQFSLRIKSLT